MTRRVTIQTPLGEQLQFRKLDGTEALNELYSLDIDLVSPSKGVDPKALLGKAVSVVVETEGLGKRYLSGLVTHFGMQGQDHRWASYKLRLRPWLWVATRKTDFKIFQHMTVPDIIMEVLGKYGFPIEKKLTRTYRTWDYCTQYGESDYNFVARLLEHEGAYYYFTHSAGSHTLVLADDIVGSHGPLPGGHVIPFYPPGKAAVGEKEHFHAWELTQEVQPGRHYNDDYDFKKPRADLSNMRQNPPGHEHDKYEIYEWPGGYTEFPDGETYAKLRLQAHLTKQSRVLGRANRRNLAPGYTINLENYPREDQNRQYLVLSVHYHFEENPEVSSSRAGGATASKNQQEVGSIQQFEMRAQPTSIDYRPERSTPKPRTRGPQTAVVVGPPGEEIWTDKFGRVKVQFHWDRIGAMDENSSCWVRVSTSWAGSQFGAVFIPRVGMEVIIDHLNGDPDYPILTGCVYNAVNMPPWSLPGNATQSGILTRSSKGGASGAGLKNGPGDANALRFEDKAGQEQLWLHAQKDQLTEVENDEEKWVGRDRKKTIDRDETNHIKRDRTETVDRNEKITVHGWRTEEVDGDETITIHSNRTERVDHSEKISIGDNRKETVGKNEVVKIGLTKQHTIGIMSMLNVGMVRMMNIGVAYSQNIGAMMSTVVGMTQTTKVGQSQKTSVGKDYVLEVGGGGAAPAAGGVDHVVAPTGGSVGGEGGDAPSCIKIDAGQIFVESKKIHLNAKDEILLTCGSSTIKLTPGQIEVLSPLDKLNC
ncbi:MAG: type VI secretion system tip protein TssI/VgrG [Acidovorax sp.]|uniref:type VI secretion system Vgr family protein n=1 Tax=Acidovorax sp. TaxID=1872122 RepID=UPI00262EFC3E|nr:type VI secretion system tip protein TssI/VgrG [Acidovorax sp.]MDH4417008.1 type VI secretion system tip protein TssI/VgrG [Acidovorax sp.]